MGPEVNARRGRPRVALRRRYAVGVAAFALGAIALAGCSSSGGGTASSGSAPTSAAGGGGASSQTLTVKQSSGGTSYLTSQLASVAQVILKQRPALVFISKYRDPDVTYHGAGLIPRTVEENYTRCFENAAGVWYRLRNTETGT